MDVNLYFSRTVTVWLMRFRIYSHNAIRAVCSIIINCHWPCKTYRLLLPPRFEVFPLFSQHWFSLNAENRGECSSDGDLYALVSRFSQIFYWPLLNWPGLDSWNRRAGTWRAKNCAGKIARRRRLYESSMANYWTI